MFILEVIIRALLAFAGHHNCNYKHLFLLLLLLLLAIVVAVAVVVVVVFMFVTGSGTYCQSLCLARMGIYHSRSTN